MVERSQKPSLQAGETKNWLRTKPRCFMTILFLMIGTASVGLFLSNTLEIHGIELERSPSNESSQGIKASQPSLSKNGASSAIRTVCRKHSECYLECKPAEHRTIWYNHGDRAGLDDRKQVIVTLANLAASVCGRLALLPPHRLLDAERHDTTISPSVEWKDFLNLSRCAITKSEKELVPQSVLYELRPPNQDPWSSWMRNYDELRNSRDNTTHSNIHLITQHPEDFRSHYQQIRKQILDKEPASAGTNMNFLWEIKVSWHAVKNEFWLESNKEEMDLPAVFADSQLRPSPGCLYLDPFQNPIPMDQHVQKVVQHVDEASLGMFFSPARTLKGFLHLRRGDSKSRCDTSLPKVSDYLQCSLGPLLTATDKRVLLLFASDEDDPLYRQELLAMVDHDFGGQHGTNSNAESNQARVQIIDLDALVLESLADDLQTATKDLRTNYYVYAIESVLKRDYADFVLERRQRHDCDDCNPPDIGLHR